MYCYNQNAGSYTSEYVVAVSKRKCSGPSRKCSEPTDVVNVVQKNQWGWCQRIMHKKKDQFT